MIADGEAHTCRGKRAGIWLSKRRPVSAKRCHIGRAYTIAREEQKTLVVSTANVALQDQIYE